MTLVLVLLAALGLSCGIGESIGSLPVEEKKESQQGTILRVAVGSEMVDCMGLGPRKCLVVDGLFFYDSIEGFDYEPGFRYVIRMERYDAWPDLEEPPQDASRYGYRLIEILEKVQER